MLVIVTFRCLNNERQLCAYIQRCSLLQADLCTKLVQTTSAQFKHMAWEYLHFYKISWQRLVSFFKSAGKMHNCISPILHTFKWTKNLVFLHAYKETGLAIMLVHQCCCCFFPSIYFSSELLLPMVTCNEEVPSNNFFMVTTDFANTTGNVAFSSWKSE